MVDFPGATSSLTASRTCRTMRPLRRIFSISDGDLHTIDMLNSTECLPHHFFHRLIAIDHHQPSPRLVIVSQGKRLGLIGFQPFFDNVFPIVGAANQSCAFDVTDAFNFWRLEVNVVDPSTGGTRTTPGNSLK